MKISRIKVFALTLAAVVCLTGNVLAGQCSDPWVTQAIQQVTNQAPIDNGNSGTCNIANFGGGRWNSYDQLLGYVKAYFGRCNDVWVTEAIINVTGKLPVDSGNSGLCNIANYNNGSWGSYKELLGYVASRIYNGPGKATMGLSGAVPSSLASSINSGTLTSANAASLISKGGAGLIGDGGGTLIGHDGATLVGNDGASIVAAGGGN